MEFDEQLLIEELKEIVDVEGVLREAQDALNRNASAYFGAAAAGARAGRNYSDMSAMDVAYAFADDALDALGGVMRLDLVADFVETVTWTEPFIMALLAFHVGMYAVAFLVRRRANAMVAFMFVIAALVFMTERLNTWGAANWTKFATQDYFDSNGLFAFIFYAAPMLLLGHILLFRLFALIAKMAIRVSVAKKREQERQQQQQQQQGVVEPTTGNKKDN
ncbi:Transmembrane protein 18 [Porphyridium purpureum]|uniref:Transmembrane protein 18 n=1 Tax=Porphyridium purpureum TaxID=35688 RepID=A0A5J4YLJ0_PORPP|nr:Transmembrane protein 18 [Porphyridium purpureum]|eukprot:POR5221..scf249_10